MQAATRYNKVISGTLVGGAVWLLALALHWSGWLTVTELKTLDHRFHRYADSDQGRATTSYWLPWMRPAWNPTVNGPGPVTGTGMSSTT